MGIHVGKFLESRYTFSSFRVWILACVYWWNDGVATIHCVKFRISCTNTSKPTINAVQAFKRLKWTNTHTQTHATPDWHSMRVCVCVLYSCVYEWVSECLTLIGSTRLANWHKARFAFHVIPTKFCMQSIQIQGFELSIVFAYLLRIHFFCMINHSLYNFYCTIFKRVVDFNIWINVAIWMNHQLMKMY